jgi:nucleotide-binding universal stress UspA family protein
MFKHLLLSVDGTDQSLRAASLGVALAAAEGAQALGMQVVQPLPAVELAGDFIVHQHGGHADRAIDHARDDLSAVASMTRLADVPFQQGCVMDRRPYTAIVAAANLAHCDLIVIGAGEYAHGHHVRLSHEVWRLLGSTDVPVLVCR